MMDTSASHDQSSAQATRPFSDKQTATAAIEDASRTYRAMLGIDLEKGGTSFEKQVTSDYRWHDGPVLSWNYFLTMYSTAQYWFVASLANGLLLIQIVLGAALTALGATNAPGSKTAVIYLGAASTIISGLLTYFKTRNQPNRARQLRQALRGVRNAMDQAVSELHGSQDSTVARQKALSIFKMYDDALKDAEINYPDLWFSLKDLKPKSSRPHQASEAEPLTHHSQSTGPRKNLSSGVKQDDVANSDHNHVEDRVTSQGLESTLVASSNHANPMIGASRVHEDSSRPTSHRQVAASPEDHARGVLGEDDKPLGVSEDVSRSEGGKVVTQSNPNNSNPSFEGSAAKMHLQQEVSSWRESVVSPEGDETKAHPPMPTVHAGEEIPVEKLSIVEQDRGGLAQDAVSPLAEESSITLPLGHRLRTVGGFVLA